MTCYNVIETKIYEHFCGIEKRMYDVTNKK